MKKLAASAALMVFLFPLAASAFAGKAPKTTLWMSKSDGALQCEPPLTQGAVESQREKLKSEGLQLLEWQHLSAGQGDGKMRIMLCGSPVGSRYRIQISSEQKPLAERLGFQAE